MVKIVSETIQEFQGVRYYKCGPYFQKDGKRLHIAVWESANGSVPKGYHVHHDDHDRNNNALDNLRCLPRSEHLRHHMAGRKEQSREICNRIRPLAAAWHGSEAGKEWHREHYQTIKDKLYATTIRACDQCRKEFDAHSGGRFCSNNCKSAWRLDAGLDLVEKECAICSKKYRVNKYWPNKTCSRSCGTTLQHRDRRASGESGCVLPKSCATRQLHD